MLTTRWRAKRADHRARAAAERQAVGDAHADLELEVRRVPRRSSAPAFEQSVSATGTRPEGGHLRDVDVLVAELDLLALPITLGILTSRPSSVFEAALDAGHDEACAVRQHTTESTACTCERACRTCGYNPPDLDERVIGECVPNAHTLGLIWPVSS